MKAKLIKLGFFLALVGAPPLQATQQLSPKAVASSCGLLGACGVVTTAVYYAYQRCSGWLENLFIDQSIDDFYLALTFNSTLNEIQDAKEKEKVLCRKAQLVRLRRNILQQLEAKVNSGTLTAEHQQSLKEQFLNPVNGILAIVDGFCGIDTTSADCLHEKKEKLKKQAQELPALFGSLWQPQSAVSSSKTKNFLIHLGNLAATQVAKGATCFALDTTLLDPLWVNLMVENPYEKTAPQNYLFNYVIERKIINTILLNYKPDSECSSSEKTKKKMIKEQKEIMVEQVAEIIKETWKKNAAGAVLLGLAKTGIVSQKLEQEIFRMAALLIP